MPGNSAGPRRDVESFDCQTTWSVAPDGDVAARATFGTGGVQALTRKADTEQAALDSHARVGKKILDTTLKTRPPDATQWTVRTLAKQLRVSRMMVHRVWQRFDIQPHRVEKFKLSNDPQFEEKVRDIAGLYLDPPERALVLCVDEKKPDSGSRPYRSDPVPLRPGLPERQTHDYKRYGTTTLFAAFHILNGKVIGSCLPRHRGKEFAKFLNQSGEASPSRPGRAHHFGQLQHAQERHRKAVAQIPKAPPFLFPLHPHQQFLAQSGGTLLRFDHRTYDPPRHFP